MRTASLAARSIKSWGPALAFGRLWEAQGLPDVLGALSRDRKFRFDVQRACFALALQRLCAPGSDLAGSRWIETVEAAGFDRLGHIVASFLALRLEVDLLRRLEERAVAESWPEIMLDLGRVQAVTVDLEGQRFRLRTDLAGSAYSAFAAAGVRPPPAVSSHGPAPPEPPAPVRAKAENGAPTP